MSHLTEHTNPVERPLSTTPPDEREVTNATFNRGFRATCRLVAISGSRSNAGKTLLAEHLLSVLDACIAIKAKVQPGALQVTEETSPRESPGKDTARFLASGARKAYFIRGPRRVLKKEVEKLMAQYPDHRVLLEANSLAGELGPDAWFFVRAPGELKRGSRRRMDRCDVVVTRADVASCLGLPASVKR